MLKIIKFIVKIILLFYLIFLKEGFLDHQKLPPIFYTPVAISIIHFLIFFLSVNIIIRFAQMIYRKRKHQGDKYSDNVIIGLQNIYYLLMVMAVIVMIIGFFGIEFSKLLTAISIVAAAIAIMTMMILFTYRILKPIMMKSLTILKKKLENSMLTFPLIQT